MQPKTMRAGFSTATIEAREIVTFERRPDGTVRLSGKHSTDGGKTLQPASDLIYAKKK